jgi:hypothetical protein
MADKLELFTRLRKVVEYVRKRNEDGALPETGMSTGGSGSHSMQLGPSEWDKSLMGFDDIDIRDVVIQYSEPL